MRPAAFISEIYRTGTVTLPITIDARPVREYFEGQESLVGPHIRSSLDYYNAFKCYRPEVVVKAPLLLDLFNDPRIIDLMEAWLCQTPCLYSVNAWWSLPGFDPQCPHNQFWHKDTDAPNFLCLFVYLTDVQMNGGPQMVRVRDNQPTIVYGDAGTVFVTDTRNSHMGQPPVMGPRLMAWARYGEGPNTNSADLDGLVPIPLAEVPAQLEDTPRSREINRLLVKFP